MSAGLVLSLFPGAAGLLDLGFEQEGFAIARGPDLLWGGDIRRFRPPPGRFDGVIGGPPCQAHSTLAHLVRAMGRRVAEDLIPEFTRVVEAAQPVWWLMENVRGAPIPAVQGYRTHAQLYDNRVTPWADGVGGEQSRVHRFSFGTRDGRLLRLELATLMSARWSHRVMASSGFLPAQLESGNGTPRRDGAGHVVRKGGRLPHDRQPTNRRMHGVRNTTAYFEQAKRLQGLPPEWDLPGFTVAAKIRALGTAVPLPMARALARAVRQALELA